jgi:4-amino-4-deoxy-L-arabinose transferase-like glycosyltransferase
VVRYLTPAILGGFFVLTIALLILLCLRKPSIRHGITLGFVLGISSLTLGATLLFIPLSAFLVLLSMRPINKTVWVTSAAIVITSCITISPWIIRNYKVFGEFIPTRIGLGFIAHQANPILAGTFYPGKHACTDKLGPMWKAKSASEAVKIAHTNRKKQGDIYERSYACIEEQAPEGYENFNEVQRDKVYLEKAKEFIISHPVIFVELVIYKFREFFFGTIWQHTIAAVLAAIGIVLVLFQKRKIESIAFILMVLLFSAPYGVTMPWNYRYRYPIEPLILLFASYAVVVSIKKIKPLVNLK